MAGRFSVETIFTAIDRISRPVLRMAARVRRATDTMARGFKKVDRATSKLLGNIRTLGTKGVAALGLVSLAMGRVIGKGADFQQTLVNAAVKFPGALELGADDFKTSLQELSEVARHTGRTTEFTALQAAGAINFLATAGFNAEQAIASLPGVVDLATAAQIDLASASDIATDALGAFNLMTDDSAQLAINLARINDVLAKTATSANVTIQTMFETMKDGAPVATSAGVSLETFAAFTGVLGSSMIKGSKAGTTLKNVVLSLSAPSKEAAKVLKRLGVATDIEGNFRDLIDILGDLNGSLAAVGTTARTAQLDAIFGKIPIAGVNILLSAGAERLREYATEIENAGGVTAKMSGIMRNTVRGSLNSLNSAVESVSLTMFAMNSGPLKETIDRLTDWVRVNEKLIATNLGEFMLLVLNNLEAIVLAARQITGVVVGLIAFSIAVKAIGAALVVAKVAFAAFAFISAGLPTLLFAATVAMGALNIAMFANPVGLIVAGVTALVGIAALVIAAWDPVTKFFGDMYDKISGVISPALQLFGFAGDSGEDSDASAAAAGSVSSPQGRAASNLQETISSSTATLNIAGAPEGSKLSTATPAPGISLQLANSGGF